MRFGIVLISVFSLAVLAVFGLKVKKFQVPIAGSLATIYNENPLQQAIPSESDYQGVANILVGTAYQRRKFQLSGEYRNSTIINYESRDYSNSAHALSFSGDYKWRPHLTSQLSQTVNYSATLPKIADGPLNRKVTGISDVKLSYAFPKRASFATRATYQRDKDMIADDVHIVKSTGATADILFHRTFQPTFSGDFSREYYKITNAETESRSGMLGLNAYDLRPGLDLFAAAGRQWVMDNQLKSESRLNLYNINISKRQEKWKLALEVYRKIQETFGTDQLFAVFQYNPAGNLNYLTNTYVTITGQAIRYDYNLRPRLKTSSSYSQEKIIFDIGRREDQRSIITLGATYSLRPTVSIGSSFTGYISRSNYKSLGFNNALFAVTITGSM